MKGTGTITPTKSHKMCEVALIQLHYTEQKSSRKHYQRYKLIILVSQIYNIIIIITHRYQLIMHVLNSKMTNIVKAKHSLIIRCTRHLKYSFSCLSRQIGFYIHYVKVYKFSNCKILFVQLCT